MKKVHGASLANALIWGAAIIGVAIVLRGTPEGGQVVVLLGGAAGASVSIVAAALRKATEGSTRRTDPDAAVETEDG